MFLISSDIYLEVEFLDHMVVLFLVFLGNFIMLSTGTVPIYIPTNSELVFPFLYVLTNTCYLLSFWSWPFWHVGGNISLCLWFAFPWWLVMLSIFSCVCWPSVCLLWKNVYSDPLPIFISHWLVFLLLSCMSPSYILDINPLSDIWFANIFSH